MPKPTTRTTATALPSNWHCGTVNKAGPERPTCTVYEGDASWHDGPGFYYVDDEYPEEGSCGAFSTWEEAAEHAVECEYARPERRLRPYDRRGAGWYPCPPRHRVTSGGGRPKPPSRMFPPGVQCADGQ